MQATILVIAVKYKFIMAFKTRLIQKEKKKQNNGKNVSLVT